MTRPTRLTPVLAIISLTVMGQAAAAQTPLPARRTLPSGLRLIVVAEPGAPVAALEVRVRVGSAQENPETNGRAHFVEHMVFKGSARGKPGDIDAAIEAQGGELTARTSRDSTRYATTIPPAQVGPALGILADMLLHPAFRPEDLEQEKSVIRGEMADADSEALRSGYADLAGAAFPASDADRLSLMGSAENLEKIDSAALKLFHDEWYRPANLTVVVVGDVKPDEIASVVTRLFPAAPELAPPPVAPPDALDVQFDGVVRAPLRPLSRMLEGELATVFLGFDVSPTSDGVDLSALEVIQSLLSDGGQGRLPDRLIGAGKPGFLTAAAFLPGTRHGLLLLSATGLREDAARLESETLAAVAALHDNPPSDDEIERARTEALTEIRYDDTSPVGLARRLADQDARGVPPSVADTYADRIRLVTPESVRALIARCLTPSRYTLAVYGVAGTPPAKTP